MPKKRPPPPALDAFVSEHIEYISRSLRRRGVPPSLLDDACQQLLLVVEKRLDEIEPGRERSYLFGVANRVAARARRSLARRREVSGEVTQDVADPLPLPDMQIDQRRAHELLDAVLAGMPAGLRTVFILYEAEGMTMAEIATMMALPHGTVASRLRRARELFQKGTQRFRARARSGLAHAQQARGSAGVRQPGSADRDPTAE